jgi:hypothetical protein
MVAEDTTTQSAPAWDWLDDLGSKVRNGYNSFVVRAPKISLLSTKTVSKNTSTSTPAAQHPQIPVGGSPLASSFEPSTPSSCATARDHLISDNQRRLLSFRPLPPITEEDDRGKILVRAVTLALRRAVSDVDQPQTRLGRDYQPQTRSSRDLRQIRESGLRRDQDAATALSRKRSRRLSLPSLRKAVEHVFSSRIAGDHFKRREGAASVAHTCHSRRSSM